MKAYIPTILLHVFYPDSRKVGFGWWLWIVASVALFVGTKISSDQWMTCSLIAGLLIGGGTIGDSIIKSKLGVKEVPDAAPAPVPPPAP